MTQQYSLKRKPYIILGIISSLLLLTVSILTSYPSWKLICYKSIISLYAIVTTIILIEVFLRQLLYYIFTTPNILWIKEIDRPRLLCYCVSLFFAYLSYKTLIDRRIGMHYWIHITTSLVSLGMSIFLIRIIWTKKFETTFIKKVRCHLMKFHDIKCTINVKEYNTNMILQELNALNCSVEIFNAFLDLREIESSERIRVKFNKAQLIRFIYTLFKVKDFEPKIKKNFINSYFVMESGEEYIRKHEATFARIDQEVLNPHSEFSNYKKHLLSIFQNNKMM